MVKKQISIALICAFAVATISQSAIADNNSFWHKYCTIVAPLFSACTLGLIWSARKPHSKAQGIETRNKQIETRNKENKKAKQIVFEQWCMLERMKRAIDNQGKSLEVARKECLHTRSHHSGLQDRELNRLETALENYKDETVDRYDRKEMLQFEYDYCTDTVKKALEKQEAIKNSPIFSIPQRSKSRWILPCLSGALSVASAGYLIYDRFKRTSCV